MLTAKDFVDAKFSKDSIERQGDKDKLAQMVIDISGPSDDARVNLMQKLLAIIHSGKRVG